MLRTKLSCLAAIVPIAVAVSLDAAGPASAAPSRRPGLYVTSFVQKGRTDVRRNEVLEIRFSEKVRRASVNERTVQVNEIGPTGARPAVGARIVQGNVVRFTPRRTQRNYDASRLPNSTVTEEDHPLGFSANAAFEVRVRAGRGVTTVRGRGGRRIAAGFVATFGTGALYDDPVPGQPSFTGVQGTGMLGFDPPRNPANGLVDDDARAVIEFSEPIDAATLRLGDTVRVTLASTGDPVPGALVVGVTPPVGSTYYFEPEGGWDAASDGRFDDVVFSLTTGITDLAGNPLERPFGPQ